MDFTKVIESRKSIRKYDPAKKVPEDMLKRVLDAFRLAPSACNIQPCELVVVTDKGTIEKLGAAYPRDWFKEAPAIIVGCVTPAKAWKRKDGASYAEVDLAIAFDHLILAAQNEGLGTCWIGAFDEKIVKEVLGIPKDVKVVAMTPLGFAAEAPAARGRKSLEEMVRRNKW